MTLPLLPGAPPTRCRCCHRPIPTGKAYDGYGEKCARERGLLPPRIPKPRTDPDQGGPTLLDLLNQPEEETP